MGYLRTRPGLVNGGGLRWLILVRLEPGQVMSLVQRSGGQGSSAASAWTGAGVMSGPSQWWPEALAGEKEVAAHLGQAHPDRRW